MRRKIRITFRLAPREPHIRSVYTHIPRVKPGPLGMERSPLCRLIGLDQLV